jgi:hypothetical protein
MCASRLSSHGCSPSQLGRLSGITRTPPNQHDTLAIVTTYRDSIRGVYIPTSVIAAFAWNSAPLDGTHIVRSAPTVGREFKFPFDFEYVQSPTMAENKAPEIHMYLMLPDSNGHVAAKILKLLLDENQMIQREDDYISIRLYHHSHSSSIEQCIQRASGKMMYRSK